MRRKAIRKPSKELVDARNASKSQRTMRLQRGSQAEYIGARSTERKIKRMKKYAWNKGK